MFICFICFWADVSALRLSILQTHALLTLSMSQCVKCQCVLRINTHTVHTYMHSVTSVVIDQVSPLTTYDVIQKTDEVAENKLVVILKILLFVFWTSVFCDRHDTARRRSCTRQSIIHAKHIKVSRVGGK